jgi:hypothetical protein
MTQAEFYGPKGLVLVIGINCVLMLAAIAKFHYQPTEVIRSPVQEFSSPLPEQQELPWLLPDPKWTVYPAIRQITNLGIVLSDIESHMPANHIYKNADRITWSHETVHGINSNIRQKFSRAGYVSFVDELPVFRSADGINGFYALKDRAIVLKEPKITITAVAKIVPKSLRGDVYNLYLVKQAASWGNQPLYIFDEWIAYTSGSACRLDLGIKERAETVQYMMEFDAYAVCLAMAIKQNSVVYEDAQFKSFLKWNIERSMSIYKDETGATGFLEKLRKNSDAEELRTFSRSYFGNEWCKKVLSF